MVFLVAIGIAAAAPVGLCAGSPDSDEPLIVFVAASLGDVVAELASRFERETDTEVLVSTGASGALRAQIELGAPCAVFVSADVAQVEALSRDGGLIDPSSCVTLATNSLVVATRSDRVDQMRVLEHFRNSRSGSIDTRDPSTDARSTSTAETSRGPGEASLPAPAARKTRPENAIAVGREPSPVGPQFLTHESIRRLAIASPDYAPAGRYAREALTHFGLWDEVRSKLIFTDNVRDAAQHAARGTVDAAIIYATDVRADERLAIVYRFPSDSHEAAVCVAGVVVREGAATHPHARALVEFLSSRSAESEWSRRGFAVDGRGDPVGGAMAEARRGATALPAASADSSLPVGKDDILTPLLLSMRVSFVAVLLILVPGTMIGVWLARTRSRWRPLVEAVSIAPLVVPPVVTGFVLLMVMQAVRFPPLFSWWAAAVAAGVVAMPLLIRTVRSSVEQIDPRLANVAKTLGASRMRVLYTVTLPLSWKGIVGGATLAWARAIGEFGATVIVAGNVPGRTQTLPLAIWSRIQSPTGGSPAPLILAAVGLSVFAVVLSEMLVRRARPEYARA